MGLDHKILHKVCQHEIINEYFLKFFRTKNEEAFLHHNQIKKSLAILVENYNKKDLEELFLKDSHYKKAFKKLSPIEVEEFFNEIDQMSLIELEFSQHIRQYDKNNFILIEAEFANEDNLLIRKNALYVNGLILPKPLEESSDHNPRLFNALTDKSLSKRIFNDPKVIIYLKKNEDFPKWLSELELDRKLLDNKISNKI